MLAQAEDGGKGLKRTLGAGNLVALGVGAIIGAGLFVRTAAAAGQAAGPAVTLSFIIAAIGCAFAGLCYAEFAAMIPISGSAYAYSYVTMGETVAWIIGWALIMEYALGAATVSIAWSEYLNKLLGGSIPYEWSHSPFESITDTAGVLHTGIMNAPSLVILLLLTLLLIKGTQESAIVNAIIVFIKVAIVIIFIVIGWQFIRPENHTPYFIPADQPPLLDASGKVVADYSGAFKHGWGGVLGGAAIVFFAPEMGGYFLEANNFIPADPLQTPSHIAPVWYFTPFYSMLRAVPNAFGGFMVMAAAIAVVSASRMSAVSSAMPRSRFIRRPRRVERSCRTAGCRA